MSDMSEKEKREELFMGEKKGAVRQILDYVQITIASFLYAVGVSLFLDPNLLAPGGITGFAIVLNRIVGLETGTWVLLLNVPILILGMWKFGWRFILSTIYCTACTGFFINALAPIGAVTEDPFLAAVVGAIFMALGIGLVFKAGATTGGSDIIIKVVKLKIPHLKTGSLFLISDGMIVAMSVFVFKNLDVALYAGLVILINSFLLDLVLYGRDGAKMLFIISDRHEQIAERILNELDVGVTYLTGSGAYSGKDKTVIFCVMRKNLSPKAEKIIRQEDPYAFTIVSSATEIFGEGYKSIYSEKL